MSELLSFDADGFLMPGLHRCDEERFLDEFCTDADKQIFVSAIKSLFLFARETHAERIIFAGSFLVKARSPKDVDCIVVYNKEEDIPLYNTCPQNAEIAYDILFSSNEEPQKVNSYIEIFSTRRNDTRKVGLVDVCLKQGNPIPWVVGETGMSEQETRRFLHAYQRRTYVERNARRGVLILIPGVNTRAEWISMVTPIANKDGWIVAPYIYDNQKRLIGLEGKRKKSVTQFRDWLTKLKLWTGVDHFSVVAHSYGTYLVTRYLEGFKYDENAPIRFDSLVFAGSIIDPKYPWSEIPNLLVNNVLNITTDNDKAVSWLASPLINRLFLREPLFGNSAIRGFTSKDRRICQRKWDILDHCSVFKLDAVQGLIIPYLNQVCRGTSISL